MEALAKCNTGLVPMRVSRNDEQKRLNELDRLIRSYGSAIPLIRVLDEIQDVIREDSTLTNEFHEDARHVLKSLKTMLLNIEEINNHK